MQPEQDPAKAVDDLRRVAAVRRAAVLALSPSERLRLVADLCRQSAILPPPPRA